MTDFDPNPDLIDDGHHRYVLLEIDLKTRDWIIIERFRKHPDLVTKTEYWEASKELRATFRALQMDMNDQKRYIVSPTIRSKIDGWIQRIDDALRGRKIQSQAPSSSATVLGSVGTPSSIPSKGRARR